MYVCKFSYNFTQISLLPRAYVQGVKQSACLSVVVGMKITRSSVLSICTCTCCKQNEMIDIGERLVGFYMLRIAEIGERLVGFYMLRIAENGLLALQIVYFLFSMSVVY